jgi:hypothetical protein
VSVLKPRSRLVYFRISDDEFAKYAKLCESVRARSLSDLARSAVHRMLVASESPAAHVQIQTDEVKLAGEIARLNVQLETITGLLRDHLRALPPAAAGPNYNLKRD